MPYRHLKAVGPKHNQGKLGPFRVSFGTPKVPDGLMEAEPAFVFGCHLVSPSRVFWPVLVPSRVSNLRLWFFFYYFFYISFLDNSGFFKSNYLKDKYLKINLDKVQIIRSFIIIQSSLLFLCMHPYFKY